LYASVVQTERSLRKSEKKTGKEKEKCYFPGKIPVIGKISSFYKFTPLVHIDN
jgi:hypothetical protein